MDMVADISSCTAVCLERYPDTVPQQRCALRHMTMMTSIPLCASISSGALPALIPGPRAQDYLSVGHFPCPTASPSFSTSPSTELPEQAARRTLSDEVPSTAEVRMRMSTKASSQLQAESACSAAMECRCLQLHCNHVESLWLLTMCFLRDFTAKTMDYILQHAIGYRLHLRPGKMGDRCSRMRGCRGSVLKRTQTS